MANQRGREDRAVAAAALAGRENGVAIGGRARELAENHTSAELREMSTSDAAAEARARKRSRVSEDKTG